jgi:hypothetical protein
MRIIGTIIIFLIGTGCYSQTLKVIYTEGNVMSITSRSRSKLKPGHSIIDKNTILVDVSSQFIYHNGTKYARIKDQGYYTFVQLGKILNSNDGEILSRYAHFLYSELFHNTQKPNYNFNIGITAAERGNHYPLVMNIDPVISFSDTIVNLIRCMEVSDSLLNATIELIPVSTNKTEGIETKGKELPITDLVDDSGKIVVRTNHPFIVRVRNESNQALHFILLDIQPDNNIIVLNDGIGNNNDKKIVGPGSAWDSPIIRFVPPYGTEVLKLIATKDPLDIYSFFNTCKASGHKESDPASFEKLFTEAFRFKCTPEGISDPGKRMTGLLQMYSITFDIEP